MPENALKITRNFRGGGKRLCRVLAGAVLLVYACEFLNRLLNHRASSYNAAITGHEAALQGLFGGALFIAGIYLLKGTFVRMGGVLLILTMIIPILAGHSLTKIGLPDSLRRIPLAILIVGIVLMYTGEGEWTLVPFAIRQSRTRATAVFST